MHLTYSPFPILLMLFFDHLVSVKYYSLIALLQYFQEHKSRTRSWFSLSLKTLVLGIFLVFIGINLMKADIAKNVSIK